MQEILALSLQAMQQDMQRMDGISANMANALTPGYKRQVTASQPLNLGLSSFAKAMQNGVQSLASGTTNPTNVIGFAPMLLQSDIQPGTLKSTGQSLDFALAGPGYFEVSTESGPAYTRQGNFHVDARGRLVTAQGYPVMGKGGDIYLTGVSPTVDAAGNVFDTSTTGAKSSVASIAGPRALNQQAVAQFKVVQFEDAKSLQRLGDGLLAGSDNITLLKDADIQIRQGFLENSNVNSMQEMVQLIQTMRHFESMAKVTTGYDDMIGQAVRKLGDM